MARLEPQFKTLSVEDIAAIVQIGREQALLMDQLAEALEACDTLRALDVARLLVGLEREVKQQ